LRRVPHGASLPIRGRSHTLSSANRGPLVSIPHHSFSLLLLIWLSRLIPRPLLLVLLTLCRSLYSQPFFDVRRCSPFLVFPADPESGDLARLHSTFRYPSSVGSSLQCLVATSCFSFSRYCSPSCYLCSRSRDPSLLLSSPVPSF